MPRAQVQQKRDIRQVQRTATRATVPNDAAFEQRILAAAKDPEKRRKAMVDLDYDFWPASLYVRRAAPGPYDVKKDERRSFKVTNRAEKALELVKKEAGIAAGDEVVLVEFPKRKRLLDLLLERARGSAQILSGPAEAARAQLAAIEKFAQSTVWARIPAQIEFQ